MHASLEGIVQDSKSKLIQTLFATSNAQKGKLTFISVGNKFKTQLLELMEKLRKNVIQSAPVDHVVIQVSRGPILSVVLNQITKCLTTNLTVPYV